MLFVSLSHHMTKIAGIILISRLICFAWWSSCFDPFNPFAHFPDTLPLFAFFDVNTFAVLFTLTPLSDVFATVGPLECTLAVLLIVLIAAYIATTVTPREGALTFHLVIDPLPAVDSAVGPSVLAFAVDVVLEEVPFVGALI